MNKTSNQECEHSTKLTGQCVKCDQYPYARSEAVTGEGNAPRVNEATAIQKLVDSDQPITSMPLSLRNQVYDLRQAKRAAHTGEGDAPRVIYLETENAWRVLDTDGTAFVANYRTKQDALAALDAIKHETKFSQISYFLGFGSSYFKIEQERDDLQKRVDELERKYTYDTAKLKKQKDELLARRPEQTTNEMPELQERD